MQATLITLMILFVGLAKAEGKSNFLVLRSLQIGLGSQIIGEESHGTFWHVLYPLEFLISGFDFGDAMALIIGMGISLVGVFACLGYYSRRASSLWSCLRYVTQTYLCVITSYKKSEPYFLTKI